MSDDLTYTGSPELTAEFVESGEIEDADDPELDNDCLSGIVCDLARAGRADLALPYIERWAKEYDNAIDALLAKYSKLAAVEAFAATLPTERWPQRGPQRLVGYAAGQDDGRYEVAEALRKVLKGEAP